MIWSRIRSLFSEAPERFGFVLGFHSISDAGHISGLEMPSVFTTPEDFRRILEEACRHAEPLPLDQAGQSERWFCVTFDDGFRDNATVALPILEELRIPASVFVTTGFALGTVLPYEIVLSRQVAQRHPEYSAESLREEYASLRWPLRLAGPSERAAFIDSLQPHASELESIRSLYLNPHEIEEFSRHALLDFESHGATHSVLPALSDDDILRELRDSKQWIESITHRTCQAFAFPYGEFNSSCTDLAVRAGYQMQMTTQPSVIKGQPSAVLPRLMCDGLHNLPDMRMSIPEETD